MDIKFWGYSFCVGFPGAIQAPDSHNTVRNRYLGTVVHIPDPNLRAAIAEALGKSPNAPITVEEMEGLGRLLGDHARTGASMI